MAFTDFQPGDSDADKTDMEKMWVDAIDQYCRDNKRDRREFLNLKSFASLKEEHNQLVDGFAKWRHSGKFVDKLRHLVNKNSDIILSAAKQISAAASAV